VSDPREPGPSARPAASPTELARRELRKSLPKRFYRKAEATQADGAFFVALDGKPALTPGRRRLAVQSLDLAQALAAEWQAQAQEVDPSQMPLTRLANSAIDGVALDPGAVRADIVKYARSDLLCYRAGEPATLVAAEQEAWIPVLDWAREALGARLFVSQGIAYVRQPPEALAALERAAAQIEAPFALTGAHAMTTLTGSALLALAVVRGRLSASEAWRAAHVDEDFQMLAWGVDAQAMARRDLRWREMEAAALLSTIA